MKQIFDGVKIEIRGFGGMIYKNMRICLNQIKSLLERSPGEAPLGFFDITL